MLKQSPEAFLSGEEISRRFGVTRAAVWKSVRQLEDDGYVIRSEPKKGYCLVSSPDILTGDEIAPWLQTKCLGRKILYYPTLVSTNTRARELAEKGEAEGTAVITEEQTGGRGRMGKKWEAKPYKSILLSVILRPAIAMADIPVLTEQAYEAVAEALRALPAETVSAKPDQLLLGGKKFCGILTECAGETDRVDYAVVGIGINVNQTKLELPSQVRSQSTSLRIELKKEISRQKLTAGILNRLEEKWFRRT